MVGEEARSLTNAASFPSHDGVPNRLVMRRLIMYVLDLKEEKSDLVYGFLKG
jgi:hypothetical protein